MIFFSNRRVGDTIEGFGVIVYRVSVAGDTIGATARHPFFVVRRGWVEAQDLDAGMRLRTVRGTTPAITSVEMMFQPSAVYNLDVRDAHTFYVGKAAVLVQIADG